MSKIIFEELARRIDTKEATIGVVGLGYVGLPLSIEIAKSGFNVIGIDSDLDKINTIKSCDSTLCGVKLSDHHDLLEHKSLIPTSNTNELEQCDCIIICVPTPLRKTRDPDLTFVINAVSKVVEAHKKTQLVVLESTTYPGFTKEILLPTLETTGTIDKDWFLAFSPERIDPGNMGFNTQTTPKVIGGITKYSTTLACRLYQKFIHTIEPVSSTEVAEMSKLLENTFRAVNIGLINEMAIMARKLHINIWDVIDAAATKPFGFMPFYPGPGLGGHCIPIDPHYLSWKLRSVQQEARFIDMASQINRNMLDHVVQITQRALNKQKKCVNGSRILALGVAYKPNVSDTRESPALEIMQTLHEMGADVVYHDPHVSSIAIGGQQMNSYPISDLAGIDCALVLTHHSSIDLNPLCSTKNLIIVDTRGATRRHSNPLAYIELL